MFIWEFDKHRSTVTSEYLIRFIELPKLAKCHCASGVPFEIRPTIGMSHGWKPAKHYDDIHTRLTLETAHPTAFHATPAENLWTMLDPGRPMCGLTPGGPKGNFSQRSLTYFSKENPTTVFHVEGKTGRCRMDGAAGLIHFDGERWLINGCPASKDDKGSIVVRDCVPISCLKRVSAILLNTLPFRVRPKRVLKWHSNVETASDGSSVCGRCNTAWPDGMWCCLKCRVALTSDNGPILYFPDGTDADGEAHCRFSR